MSRPYQSAASHADQGFGTPGVPSIRAGEICQLDSERSDSFFLERELQMKLRAETRPVPQVQTSFFWSYTNVKSHLRTSFLLPHENPRFRSSFSSDRKGHEMYSTTFSQDSHVQRAQKPVCQPPVYIEPSFVLPSKDDHLSHAALERWKKSIDLVEDVPVASLPRPVFYPPQLKVVPAAQIYEDVSLRSMRKRDDKVHPYVIHQQQKRLAAALRGPSKATTSSQPVEKAKLPTDARIATRMAQTTDSCLKIRRHFRKLDHVYEFGVRFDLTSDRDLTVLFEEYLDHLISLRHRTKVSELERDRAYASWVGCARSRSLFAHYGSLLGFEECIYARKIETMSVRSKDRAEFYAVRQAKDEDWTCPNQHYNESDCPFCSQCGVSRSCQDVILHPSMPKQARSVHRSFFSSMISTVLDSATRPVSDWLHARYEALELYTSAKVAAVEAEVSSLVDKATTKVDVRFDEAAVKAAARVDAVVAQISNRLEEINEKASARLDEFANKSQAYAEKAANDFGQHLKNEVVSPLRVAFDAFKDALKGFSSKVFGPLTLPQWALVALETVMIVTFFVVAVKFYMKQVSAATLGCFLAALFPVPFALFMMRLYEWCYDGVDAVKQTKDQPTTGDFWTAFCSFFPSGSGLEKGGWAEGIPRFKRLVDAISWFCNNAWKFILWTYTKITGVPIPTSELESEITTLAAKWRPVHDEYQQNGDWFTTFRTYPHTVIDVTRLYTEAVSLEKRVYRPQNGCSPALVTVYAQMCKDLQQASSRSEAFLKIAGERACPWWLNLFGGKGVGKTFAANHIRTGILTYHYRVTHDPAYEAQTLNDVFMLPQGETYFDAYNGQKMMAVDDIFQAADAKACQPLALFLMPFVSTCPCPLLCATPEAKGKVCVADYLVTTSNDEKFTNLGLRHPAAFHDRISLNVELVHVDENYNVVEPSRNPWKRMFRIASNYQLRFPHMDQTKGLLDEDMLIIICVRSFLKQKADLSRPREAIPEVGPSFTLQGPRYEVAVEQDEDFEVPHLEVPVLKPVRTFAQRASDAAAALLRKMEAKASAETSTLPQHGTGGTFASPPPEPVPYAAIWNSAINPNIFPSATTLGDDPSIPVEGVPANELYDGDYEEPLVRSVASDQAVAASLRASDSHAQETFEPAVRQVLSGESERPLVKAIFERIRLGFEASHNFEFLRLFPEFSSCFSEYDRASHLYTSYVRYLDARSILPEHVILVPLHPLLVAFSTRQAVKALRTFFQLSAHPDKPGFSGNLQDLYVSTAATTCLQASQRFVERTADETEWSNISYVMPFIAEILWSSDRESRPFYQNPIEVGGPEGYERFLEEFQHEDGWRKVHPHIDYKTYLWGCTAVHICNILKISLCFIASIVVIRFILYAIVNGLSSFFSASIKDEVSEQSGAPKGGATGRRIHTPRGAKVFRAINRGVGKQTREEETLVEHVINQSLSGEESAVLSNLVKVSFNGSENWILGLACNVAVTTTHSIQKMTEGKVVRLNCSRAGSMIEVLWEDVQLFTDCDDIYSDDAGEIVFLSFPTIKQALFRDITAHFSTTQPQRGEPAVRFTPALDSGDKFYVTRSETTNSWDRLSQPILGCEYEFRSMSNGVGYCGLPYMTRHNSKFCIFAIHGAGREHARISLGHAISKDDVDSVITMYKNLDETKRQCATSSALRFDGKRPFFPVLSSQPQHFIPGTKPLGVLPPKQVCHLQSHTNLVKTPLHPESEPLVDEQGPILIPFVPTRKPARLTPEPGYFPAAMPLNKYGEIGGEPNLSPPIPDELLAALPYEQLLPPDFRPPDRLLSIDEAINGSPELGVPSIDLTKSPGFPYISTGLKRPQVLYQTTGDRVIRTAFREDVAALQKQLETEVVPCIVVDCLKDELLPFEDVDAGKVRVFCTAELTFVVLARMFFELLTSALTTFPWRTPIAIGIDPGTMWTELFERLHRMSHQCMAGDFKGQEFTIPTQYVECFADFCDFINPLPFLLSIVRRNLIRSLLGVIHAFRGDVYATWKGQGSGTGPTALFASFSSWVFHITAWRSLGLSDSEFSRRVACTFMGDDSVVAVRDEPSYSMVFLAQFARTIGMYYTSGDKKSVSEPYCSIFDIEYLRRRFCVYNRFLVLAPLRLSSIMENPMWRRTSSNHEDEKNTWLSVFVDLVHHDSILYEQMRSIALRYSARTGLGLVVPPYKHAFDRLRFKITGD